MEIQLHQNSNWGNVEDTELQITLFFKWDPSNLLFLAISSENFQYDSLQNFLIIFITIYLQWIKSFSILLKLNRLFYWNHDK